MFSWVAKRLIVRNMKALRAGDIEPTLALDAEDVRAVLPGKSSFAVRTEGKAELREWLTRFAEVGLQIYPDEVVATGPLWRQRICVRGHTHLDDPERGRVYENRYVIWGRSRWGKVYEYEVYEDTEASSGLDDYLASRPPRP